jgi:hypothetical protein
VVGTKRGPGGEKTQPTGTTLVDVVVELEEDVWLLVVVEAELEDVVREDDVSLVEDAEFVEVDVGPLTVRKMPTPPAIAMMTTMATAAAILPIPLREAFVIIPKNKRSSIFKTYQGDPSFFGALWGPASLRDGSSSHERPRA